jgi:uncharacterized ferritin-like protein (DUF455 family)
MKMEKAILMGKPALRSVEESSNDLKRLYLLEREVMRTLGGFLVSVNNWNLKKQLPAHIWRDSLRANGLRTRILEMRYPRRDVDKNHDDQLLGFLALLIRSHSDAELLQGVYYVSKKAVLEAYREYKKLADPLDDAPTVMLINDYIPELERQMEDVAVWLQQLPSEELQASEPWRLALAQYLHLNGGALGAEKPTTESKPFMPTIVRSEYMAPIVPGRDPSFTDAKYHLPPQFKQADYAPKFIERQVWQGINHVNEIWAAEITGLVLWKWNDMPWEFYLDCARWCFDESRHCRMGDERLSAWGFQAGVDYPVYSDHYVSSIEYGELATLALLHRFETTGPNWKSGLMREFEQVGDTSSSQDFDYDWADESIHLTYGHKWALHRLGGDLDALEKLKEEMYGMWHDWLAERHKQWDYQPFLARIEAKIKQIEVEHNG